MAVLRFVLIVAAYGLAYRVGYLMRVPPENLAAAWPATGVALGILLVTPRPRRWSAAVALSVGNLAASTLSGNPLLVGVEFLAVNVLEAAIGLAILTSREWTLTSFGRVPGVGRLLAAATVGNGLSSIVGAAVVSRTFGLSLPEAYLGWWSADGLGIVLVTPFVVTVARWLGRPPRISWPRVAEGALFLALWSASGWAVFHVGHTSPWFVPLPYAMLGLLTWAGLRLGPDVVALAICLLAGAASASPLVGYGPSPLGGGDARARLLLLQAYLAVTAVTGLLLAASRRETTDALEAARDEKARVDSLADHLPDGLVFELTRDAAGLRFLYISAAVHAIAGVAASDVLRNASHLFDLVDPEDRHLLRPLLEPADADAQAVHADVRLRRSDGETRWATLSSSPRRIPGRGVVWDGILVDITAQRRSQEALRAGEARVQAAQRIELVGQLAGGIAHDFNNLLTVIMGHADLLLHDATDPEERGQVRQIAEAARRASWLTQQLLAYGRRTMLSPVVLDLNDLIRRTVPLVTGTVGEAIAVRLAIAPEELRVQADPSQLERVLLNLAINARDAMPDGGTLEIATGKTVVTAGEAQERGVAPGRYARLSVTDTGVGMTPEVRSRLFEPFFTTKPVGHGTGLGLAAVYGVVHQSDGFIDVATAPGRGTTFTVCLPERTARVNSGAIAAVKRPTGTERVLVVEDDRSVRDLLERSLRRLGYTVVTAANGEDGLAVAAGTALDLVITDIMMPGMAGPELAVALRDRWPHLKVLFISGYSDDAVLRRGVESGRENLLAKPFTAATLAAKVREVIDAGR
jgi:PAS domain S-box-containing protein